LREHFNKYGVVTKTLIYVVCTKKLYIDLSQTYNNVRIVLLFLH